MTAAVTRPRFIVVESEGFPIRGNLPGPPTWTPMLGVSVLDSADCYRVIAQIDEERELHLGRWYHNKPARREAMRNRAHGIRATLEAEYATV
jgi:hypothetical protein